MVRKSVLVYDLLKSQKPEEGLTENEIIHRLNTKYGFTPGKGTKRQINIALRRGVDYGILVKETNKYRFDPDSVKSVPRKKSEKTKKRRVAKKGRTTRKKTIAKTETRPPVPRPKVPPLPNWTPKIRDLRDEPLSKVIKHPKSPSS